MKFTEGEAPLKKSRKIDLSLFWRRRGGILSAGSKSAFLGAGFVYVFSKPCTATAAALAAMEVRYRRGTLKMLGDEEDRGDKESLQPSDSGGAYVPIYESIKMSGRDVKRARRIRR